ncbi:hypothetical protein MMC16_005939 [Acarospora aff. strigata]|nr:hypothetical protein [Acarospora aff. strigata]
MIMHWSRVASADTESESSTTTQGLAVVGKVVTSSSIMSGGQLPAIFVALLGVLGQAGGMVAIRRIGPRAHPLVSMNYSSVTSIVFCGLALSVVPGVGLRMSMSPVRWVLLLLVTFCGFLFQLLLTEGLRYGAKAEHERVRQEYDPPSPSDCENGQDTVPEKKGPKRIGANRAVGMMYTQALFALMYDWTIWRNLPSWSSWAGIVLIVTGAIWVAMLKSLRLRDQVHR